jgi:hypothetical protein
MRNIIPALVSILLLASCAAPKYSYNFDYYDYNSGKKHAEKVIVTTAETTSGTIEQSPLVLTEESLEANADNATPVELAPAPVVKDKTVVGKKYSDLTKAEKKEFRKALKSEIKNYIKAKKSGDNGAVGKDTKAMDYNLKMAIIFAAVAVTLSFFGGVNSVFWILSVVSLVVAVVFFVKWIAEQ